MRYEWKYIIPNHLEEQVLKSVAPFVTIDNYAAKTGDDLYTVRSIYFDTPRLEMFHSKKAHIGHRLKVRIRGYGNGNDDSTVFCEIKRKYEGPIVKNRASMTYGQLKHIFDGSDPDEILPLTYRKDDLSRFFYQIHRKQLQPIINILYERIPFHSRVIDKENNFRLSIDRDWRSVAYPSVDELFVDRNIVECLKGHFVLEVKFNKYCPAWLRAILNEMNFEKVPASKYVICVESQHQIINQWQRSHLFTRHYDTFANSKQ